MEEELMVVIITGLICGTIIIGMALQALVARRGRQAPSAKTDATEGRLARMEQAIDAIAVEIERIAEGQRFTTRVLTEGRGEEVPVSRRVQS